MKLLCDILAWGMLFFVGCFIFADFLNEKPIEGDTGCTRFFGALLVVTLYGLSLYRVMG